MGAPLRVAPLLAVFALVAGCTLSAPGLIEGDGPLGPFEPASEATLKRGAFLAFKVRSFDGTPIHVDVRLPEGDGPFPTLIEYTPYALLGDEFWGLAGETGIETPLSGSALVDFYVPRGYAVGVAHVRGTGESGGCLTIGGPEEARDGYSVVEHIANQSWSNDRVALVGTSYVGTTPLEVATLQPPHLSAIVPISPVTEWYRYYFELGAHRRNGDPFPGSSDTDPVLWGALGVAPGFRTGAFDPMDAVCVAEFALEDYGQDDYDAWWKARDIAKDARNITVPVLYAQGWRDENVATNMIPRFWANLTGDKHAWFQQHGHGVPSSKETFYDTMHRFLDMHLLNVDTGADLAPAVILEDNLGAFRAEATWPPRDAAWLRFFPAPDGKLLNDTADGGRLSWRDDGTGRTEDVLEGVNHLRFASEPLANETHVAGVPRIHLKASSDMPGTHLDVLLYDRAPGGEEKLLTRGYLDARHRDSLEEGKDLVPGTVYDFEFELHPRDHRVEAGHSLVLVLKSTDDYVVRSPYRATNTLLLGMGASWIDLPVVYGRTFSEAPALPWG